MKKQKPDKIYIGCASFYPHQIVTYCQPIDGWNQTHGHRLNQFNLESNDHHGKLSVKARRKIEKAINWLLFTAKQKTAYNHQLQKSFKFRINFITLTLPATQVHADQLITNKCLGNWLEVAKKRFGLKNYVWKAEAQVNGSIHYHLVTDCFIPHQELRRTWNQSTELLGYVSAFEFRNRHRNPNSTDIHSVKNVKRISSYIACYMSKNQSFECIGKLIEKDGHRREVLYNSAEYMEVKEWRQLGKVVGSIIGNYHRPITSRLWGCSRTLSQIKPVRFREDEYSLDSIYTFIKQSNFRAVELDRATLYFGDVAAEAKTYFPQVYTLLLKAAAEANQHN